MELKERIISEAEALFCQYGLKRITMDDIAKHLGISKKTIYLHFKDKDELVNKVMTDILNRESGVSAKNEVEARNAVEEIFLIVTHLRDLLSKLNPMFFYDMQKYYPKAWGLFTNYRHENLKCCLVKNLQRGVEEGIFRTGINNEIISIMRMEQIDMVFNQIAYAPGKYNLSEVMTEITEHYIYGLCNAKGHALMNELKYNVENIQNL